MVDPQTQIQLSRSYTPFGEELGSSGSYETPFGFAGEMHDASGLLYLRARYLSTETGRFTSTDSFAGYLNYPASMNPYQYAYNNPLKYVDPSGNIAINALQWAQVGMDLYSMVSQYADRNCTTVEQLTRNVLAGAASVVVGIAVGAVVGALGVALFPGSLLAAVAFGALGGAMAGQYARLVSNLILGRDPTEGMYNPRDMLVDGILGGIGGAAGFLSAKVLKATGGGLALALGLTVSVDVGIGELAYAVNQRLHGEEYEFSWQRVALNAAISTVTFGVGYGIGKGYGNRSADAYNKEIRTVKIGGLSITIGSYGKLLNARIKDGHHIYQDAAVRELAGYNRRDALAVVILGPANKIGTPHYLATQAQNVNGGGTLGFESDVAITALRAAGFTKKQSGYLLKEATRYFESLGHTMDSITRIPGNRH